MVIHDLYVFRTRIAPHEADTVLVVYPDAVLPFPVASQSLESVPRRNSQIVDSSGGLKLAEPPQGDTLERLEALYARVGGEPLRIRIFERNYHEHMISYRVINVKRY